MDQLQIIDMIVPVIAELLDVVKFMPGMMQRIATQPALPTLALE